MAMQDFNMHTFHFDDQYNTYHSYGYAVAPGSQAYVGNEEAFKQREGMSHFAVVAFLCALLVQGSYNGVIHCSNAQ